MARPMRVAELAKNFLSQSEGIKHIRWWRKPPDVILKEEKFIQNEKYKNTEFIHIQLSDEAENSCNTNTDVFIRIPERPGKENFYFQKSFNRFASLEEDPEKSKKRKEKALFYEKQEQEKAETKNDKRERRIAEYTRIDRSLYNGFFERK
ncbi:MAG: hypothetical protein Ta2E_09730 [Mycoplasmoidaceae bacterium]|nr:MAG: hypothetical protein Ta2E_09730 [Mycoplasmoidaceae bacterium]